MGHGPWESVGGREEGKKGADKGKKEYRGAREEGKAEGPKRRRDEKHKRGRGGRAHVRPRTHTPSLARSQEEHRVRHAARPRVSSSCVRCRGHWPLAACTSTSTGLGSRHRHRHRHIDTRCLGISVSGRSNQTGRGTPTHEGQRRKANAERPTSNGQLDPCTRRCGERTRPRERACVGGDGSRDTGRRQRQGRRIGHARRRIRTRHARRETEDGRHAQIRDTRHETRDRGTPLPPEPFQRTRAGAGKRPAGTGFEAGA